MTFLTLVDKVGEGRDPARQGQDGIDENDESQGEAHGDPPGPEGEEEGDIGTQKDKVEDLPEQLIRNLQTCSCFLVS